MCSTESTDVTTQLGSHFQGVQPAARQRGNLFCAAHPTSEVLTQPCWWGLSIQVLLFMEQPCGMGSSFVLSLLSIHAVVQFNWDVDFNLFLKCHFLPAFLLLLSEMLLSSGCSYREPAPFWKAKGSLLTATFVLN